MNNNFNNQAALFTAHQDYSVQSDNWFVAAQENEPADLDLYCYEVLTPENSNHICTSQSSTMFPMHDTNLVTPMLQDEDDYDNDTNATSQLLWLMSHAEKEHQFVSLLLSETSSSSPNLFAQQHLPVTGHFYCSACKLNFCQHALFSHACPYCSNNTNTSRRSHAYSMYQELVHCKQGHVMRTANIRRSNNWCRNCPVHMCQAQLLYGCTVCKTRMPYQVFTNPKKHTCYAAMQHKNK